MALRGLSLSRRMSVNVHSLVMQGTISIRELSLKVHMVSDVPGLYQSTIARCEDLWGTVQLSELNGNDAGKCGL